MDSKVSINNISSSQISDSSKDIIEENKNDKKEENKTKVIYINNINYCSMANRSSIDKIRGSKQEIKIKFEYKQYSYIYPIL